MEQATEEIEAGLSLGAPARTMPPSRIRAIMDLAWSLGEGVSRLEVGEPDLPTPAHVVEAAARAARQGHTRYLPNAGLADLREAAAAKLVERNRIDADASSVVVTAGGVQALYLAMSCLLEPGTGILIPDPAWPDFAMQAHILGLRCQPYPLTREDGYLPDPERIERLIEPGTRALLLNSPSNPLGTVIPAETLAQLLEVAERHDLWVISDEVYDDLTFDGPFVSTAAAAPSPRIVSIFSFSKVYAMTGWRVGYVAAAPPVAKVLTAVQEPLVSCVNAPAQHGALAALTGPQTFVEEARESYRARRDLAVERLRAAGLEPLVPTGTFYVWVPLPDGAPPTSAFADALLRERLVAVAPGVAFGAQGEGHLRISIASSERDIERGIAELGKQLDKTIEERENHARS